MKKKIVLPVIATILVLGILAIGIYFGSVKQAMVSWEDTGSQEYVIAFGACRTAESWAKPVSYVGFSGTRYTEYLLMGMPLQKLEYESQGYGRCEIRTDWTKPYLGETCIAVACKDCPVGMVKVVRGPGLSYYECINPEEKIDAYRFQNNQCTLISILPSEKTINDYLTLQECEQNIVVLTAPPIPEPHGFNKFISIIVEWFKDLFSRIFGLQSIVGSQTVEPNTQHTYQIDLSAPIPDSDYTDGTYQIQYANWALVDSNGNIIQEGTWEKIDGVYTKSVTITTPANIGDYILLGMITQFDMNFDSNTGQWITSEETIINKEAIDLKTEHSITAPEVPIPGGFTKFIASIVEWFKNLWSSIFGV
jgi:hypothetical protein